MPRRLAIAAGRISADSYLICAASMLTKPEGGVLRSAQGLCGDLLPAYFAK
jgi:hypothetical protein